MARIAKLSRNSVLVVSMVLGQLGHAGNVVSKISPEYMATRAYENTDRIVGQRLNIPFYFNVVNDSMLPLNPELQNQRESTSTFAPVLFEYKAMRPQNNALTEDKNELGLRLVGVRSDDRMKTSNAIADSGMFEIGDIVLSFRPEWYSTLKYSHIQLGVSHSALMYMERGSDGKMYARNFDMPLDGETQGPGYFNSKHYVEAPFLHVLRLRDMSEKQKSNLNRWIQLSVKNTIPAYKSGTLSFNKDYAQPKYREGKPMKFVGDVGRLALGKSIDDKLDVYCSEMTWAVLALRNCDPDDSATAAQFARTDVPSCVEMPFDPMPVLGDMTTATDLTSSKLTVGMADGISLLVNRQFAYMPKVEDQIEARQMMIGRKVFSAASGGGEKISSGHLAVESQLGPQFFDAIKNYYMLVSVPGMGADPRVLGIRQAMNAAQLPNYSPTAFMTQVLVPNESPVRRMDYVGTLVYAQKIRLASGRSTDTYTMLRNIKMD